MTDRHVGGQYNRYKDTGGKVHRECGLPWADHIGLKPDLICPDDPRADLRSQHRREQDLNPIEHYAEDDTDYWGGPVDLPEPSPDVAALFDDQEV